MDEHLDGVSCMDDKEIIDVPDHEGKFYIWTVELNLD